MSTIVKGVLVICAVFATVPLIQGGCSQNNGNVRVKVIGREAIEVDWRYQLGPSLEGLPIDSVYKGKATQGSTTVPVFVGPDNQIYILMPDGTARRVEGQIPEEIRRLLEGPRTIRLVPENGGGIPNPGGPGLNAPVGVDTVNMNRTPLGEATITDWEITSSMSGWLNISLPTSLEFNPTRISQMFNVVVSNATYVTQPWSPNPSFDRVWTMRLDGSVDDLVGALLSLGAYGLVELTPDGTNEVWRIEFLPAFAAAKVTEPDETTHFVYPRRRARQPIDLPPIEEEVLTLP